ncbi:hypothetical protein CFC21_000352 [Triticum aestivum]|uniref:Uncharacterized protein n=1 Tax=Triticum aestivum TaxID=4565 RepID=A0A3B5XTZ3_WHEAT|nr:hypothetical protein CFC21_000352 [Triticum aestivum]
MAAVALLPSLLPSPPRSEMPPLLPTPPRSEMLPLLPTPHGVILTMLVSAMPGRADFVKRWDWNKKRDDNPCSSICSSSSEGSGSACRADSVGRWDSHKKYKAPRTTMSSSSSSSQGAGSPGRADSVERWDSKKLESSPPTDRGRHVGNGNKRLPSPSRASSADRWDLHKKPRPEQMEKPPQTNAAATTPALAMMTPHKAVFAGPSFYATPDPSMLPMPSFFLLARPRALCTQ